MTCDTNEALEALVRVGCCRVLTSGGRNTAPEGIENIHSLVKASAGRIDVMAGSGVQGIPEYASIGIDPTMIRNILNQLI